MAQEQRISQGEARRFARVAFAGRMVYRYASDDEGTAEVSDVSRGGLRMTMGRYLRPGTPVMLEAAGVRVNGRAVELKGRIVWCAPEMRGHRFVAGVRVIYDEPDAVTAVSALVNHALHASGVLDELKDRAAAALNVAAAWQIRAIGNGVRVAGSPWVAGNA
ncbi:MAG: PilZ domain-containing protein [Candidatus Hydrogenedentes bacterium]|nr:PilZ domain-containing protein [Candidatus Hydrogenedentota bacterium]